mmetsp:Transcript_7392/g.18386  ORF Transcript_7392/g.18386 Transcript_7392/m.18386 type:complete len:308 (+) Transcript_7392:502-1425(+)
MFALSDQNRLVRVNALPLDDERDVAEIRVIQKSAHVFDKSVHGHVIQRTFLQPAHVQYVEVVEPLIAVETTKYVNTFRTDQRSTVSLAPRRRLRGFCRPRRPHPFALLGVEDVQLVCAAFSIVATEEEHLVPDKVCCVPSQARRWCAKDFRLRPLQALRVEDVEVREVLVAAVPAEQVKLCADHGHCVSVAGLGQSTRQCRLHPSHGLEVDNVHVVETFRTIVTTEHVKLVGEPRERVAGAGRRRSPGGLHLMPTDVLERARRRGGCVEDVHVRHPFAAVVATVDNEALLHNGGGVVIARCGGASVR